MAEIWIRRTAAWGYANPMKVVHWKAYTVGAIFLGGLAAWWWLWPALGLPPRPFGLIVVADFVWAAIIGAVLYRHVEWRVS